MERDINSLREKEQIKLIKRNPQLFKKIINPTLKVQYYAVRGDGENIQYIDKPCERIQFEALKEGGYIIRLIDVPSYNVLLHSVMTLGISIKYIDNPSEELQLEAVKNDGLAIKFINNPSEKLKMIAVKQNGYALRYIKNPSLKIQLMAVKQNGMAIQYIDNPSYKLKVIAVKSRGASIVHIKDLDLKLILLALKEDISLIRFINEPSETVQIEAIKKYGGIIIDYIENPTAKVQNMVKVIPCTKGKLYISNVKNKVRFSMADNYNMTKMQFLDYINMSSESEVNFCKQEYLDILKELESNRKPAIEIAKMGGLKCDNSDCDWSNMDIKTDEYKDYIGYRCPKCGDIVFTRKEYYKFKLMLFTIKTINFIFPKSYLLYDDRNTLTIQYGKNGKIDSLKLEE